MTRLSKQWQKISLSGLSDVLIRHLQQLRNGLLSGDESATSTWDELCVQMQSEPSFDWEAYEETALALIRPMVQSLAHFEQAALWLQTDCGFDLVGGRGRRRHSALCARGSCRLHLGTCVRQGRHLEIQGLRSTWTSGSQ